MCRQTETEVSASDPLKYKRPKAHQINECLGVCSNPSYSSTVGAEGMEPNVRLDVPSSCSTAVVWRHAVGGRTVSG